MINRLKTDTILSSDVYPQVMKEMTTRQIRTEYRNQIRLYSDGYYHVRLHDAERTQVKSKTVEGVIDLIYKRVLHETQATFRRAFEEKIKHDLDIGGNPNTTRTHKDQYKRFVAHTDLEEMVIGDIDRIKLINILDQMVVKWRGKISSRSFGNYISLLNGVFSFARLRGYTELETDQLLKDYRKNLNRALWKSTARRSEDEVFSDEEDEALISYICEHTWNDMRDVAILFARFTGNRPGENVALKASDFDGYELHYNRTQTKDENGRVIVSEHCKTLERECTSEVLSDVAIAIFNHAKELNPNGEYLFEVDGKRLTSATLDHRLRILCKKIGIPPRSMNKLRKTFASDLSRRGIPDKVLQRQMGHTDIKTTRKHYIKHNTGVETIHNMMNDYQNEKFFIKKELVSSCINP